MTGYWTHVCDLSIVFLLFMCSGVENFRGPLRQQFAQVVPPMIRNGIDPGKPLFLTPFLESGEIDTARKLSIVAPLNGTTVSSYAGFLTVNKLYNSNMFFWFFPAKTAPDTAPVLLWLQGGPGGSSLFALFNENGPFYLDENMNLHPREYTWTSKYSVLYIDNPVGTGFSFTDDDLGYSTNETQVAENLYSCLEQFFQIYTDYQKNDFYVTGESYAGKYVPAIGYKLHMMSMKPQKVKIQFRGIAIGDGLIDPITMMPTYADYLFNIGLLDENQREYFRSQTDQVVKYIQAKQWLPAFKLFDGVLNGDLTGVPSYFTNVTGSTNYFNYLKTKSPPSFNYMNRYLSYPEVRRAIHVGDLVFHTGDKVEQHLLNDFMKSTKPWLAVLMDNYKVLLYTGQLDIIVALPLTEAMLQTVPWKGLSDYKSAVKTIWRIKPTDQGVAGYVRNVGSFYQVLVRNGGHILPYDQPAASFDMIERFITGRGF